jgi:hypothetical protein
LLVIDKSGGGPYIDVHDINEHPPLEDLVSAVDELTKISHSAHPAKNDKRLAIRAEHPGRDRRNITA